jgi:NAD(P)-dependent dehydrogenase (short-subunit alcohol dehydrogenase family)
MDIQDKTALLLGGSGLVGLAVARALIPHGPRKIILSALTQAEVEPAVEELRAEAEAAGIQVAGEWGDIFWPDALKGRSREEVLGDPSARNQLLDDLYGDLTDDVIARSSFASLIDRHRPELVVDCVNTATAFAYQNVFASAARLREEAREGECKAELVERHLATLYLPQLIRHVQIALESMRRAGTRFYLKVGTAGTGGMGLNIPFTHSEERPSRMLLAKSGVAGAHTLLLYLMARTPGAPAVKEIKPTAAISWKSIGYGPIRKRGQAIQRFDAVSPMPLDAAFDGDVSRAYKATGQPLEGVYVDAGENGLFSLGEFETLTALGLMEYITPEEIADDVVREIRGYPTGHDVVAALDGATSGPTYRAGVLRETALARMEALERERGVQAVAYEMLGPPRLSKLLFEVALLARLYPDMDAAAGLDPEEAARRTAELIDQDEDLRVRILSIGLPILLPDGERLLRGPAAKVAPEPGQSVRDPRLVDNGWVDLRAQNWARWRERLETICHELDVGPGAADGSRVDREPHDRGRTLRPGRLAAWIFRYEDAGERMKR